ncbi:helix-turn-helix transcriptional regulator [Albidovulum sediminicola]|uniref:Helix-turn-helix transcriptional regulator n=1 Tax=Albidovulum sediminicola TaxID=2984331 RepID=A0ABT2Z4Z5_9RHOB|nr:helix-turn-helix transcriptional regulator [Defluviimonas sp. WL0075]MCV2865846.1 helix-turn-helix transcriptional regulator [Defluviimonas sp. WL0075]
MHVPTSFPTVTSEEALADAIDAVGRPEFVPATLDYLRLAAPFHGCLALIFESGKRPVHVYDNVRAERRAVVIDRYLDGAYLLDPFREYFQSSRGDAVARLRDVAPDRFRNSTYYQSYYSHIRLKDEIGIFVALASGKTLFFSIGPMGPERDFSAADARGLRRVLPVLSALCRRHFDRYDPGETGSLAVNIEEVLTQGPGACLTPRESQIAGLILKGHSTEAIARMIGISGGTVKLHRKNIYRKLGISSQGELFNLLLSEMTKA